MIAEGGGLIARISNTDYRGMSGYIKKVFAETAKRILRPNLVATTAAEHDKPAVAQVRSADLADIIENPPVPQSRKTLAVRLIYWFLFGVIVGLLPLFFEGIQEWSSRSGFNWNALLDNGELLIVSAVISAGALGELLFGAAPDRESLGRGVAGFGCLMCCMGNSVLYMQARSPQASPNAIVHLSIGFFVVSVVASAACMWIAAGAE